MNVRTAVASVSALILASSLSAQAVIETPKATIEVIGLHRWTLAMIEDSLGVYSPKDQLTAHACAAILRDKLHFADAAVSVYLDFDKTRTKPYVAVTVVEPDDSALIHYKPAFRDSSMTRAEWLAAWTAFRANSELTQRAIQTPSFYARTLSPADSATFAKIDAIHALLVAPREARAFDDARHVLESDGSTSNRVMASMVIATFGERDDAWRTLADAMRDPVGIVTGTASQLLHTLGKRSPREIDWAPMAPQLRYIIDGTNLFAFNTLVTSLTTTSVSPSLAPALLAGGGAIVRSKLHSGDVASKQAITEFLTRLSGLPADSDARTFEAWMERLPRGAAF